MTENPHESLCLQCNSGIDAKTYQNSLKKFKFPLCEDCQIWFIGKVFCTTKETLDLYFALKKRGIGAQLEKHERYKKMEIAIQGSTVLIEVEGGQHHYNVNEVLMDLSKSHHDLQDGYMSIRIPDALVKFHIDQTTDILQRLAADNKSGSAGSKPC